MTGSPRTPSSSLRRARATAPGDERSRPPQADQPLRTPGRPASRTHRPGGEPSPRRPPPDLEIAAEVARARRTLPLRTVAPPAPRLRPTSPDPSDPRPRARRPGFTIWLNATPQTKNLIIEAKQVAQFQTGALAYFQTGATNRHRRQDRLHHRQLPGSLDRRGVLQGTQDRVCIRGSPA